MKSWITKAAIAIAMVAALPILAQADTWQIDPMHTNVEFTVRHMMISNVKGQFQKTSGTITVNGNDPASAKIDATIDASSIDTRVEKRDMHLKSPGFSRRREVPDHHLQINQGRSRGAEQIQGDGRSHAARCDQAGGARG